MLERQIRETLSGCIKNSNVIFLKALSISGERSSGGQVAPECLLIARLFFAQATPVNSVQLNLPVLFFHGEQISSCVRS